MAGNDYWNPRGEEKLAAGTAGNQAHFPIFYRNARGNLVRLTEAEGHTVNKNPETEDKNTIGLLAAKTVVKSYRDTFDKAIIITHDPGDPDSNYEFFAGFGRRGYTGKNAVVEVVTGDFGYHEPDTGGTKDVIYAEKMNMTVAVSSSDFTAGTLSVSFSQAGDKEYGVLRFEGDSVYPVFVPSSQRAVTAVVPSNDDVGVRAGGEASVEIKIAPLGSPLGFLAESDNPGACTAEIIRNSVIIRGIAAGTATVTVASADNASKTAEIEVTVSA
ncbi:MAG: hypothetical protein LBI91_01210 [Spirochaetaceae bacterium]|jgi:hypothetical protein|nr:hypothetical protein [Spirochaetaceae bacterium]